MIVTFEHPEHGIRSIDTEEMDNEEIQEGMDNTLLPESEDWRVVALRETADSEALRPYMNLDAEELAIIEALISLSDRPLPLEVAKDLVQDYGGFNGGFNALEHHRENFVGSTYIHRVGELAEQYFEDLGEIPKGFLGQHIDWESAENELCMSDWCYYEHKGVRYVYHNV